MTTTVDPVEALRKRGGPYTPGEYQALNPVAEPPKPDLPAEVVEASIKVDVALASYDAMHARWSRAEKAHINARSAKEAAAHRRTAAELAVVRDEAGGQLRTARAEYNNARRAHSEKVQLEHYQTSCDAMASEKRQRREAEHGALLRRVDARTKG